MTIMHAPGGTPAAARHLFSALNRRSIHLTVTVITFDMTGGLWGT